MFVSLVCNCDYELNLRIEFINTAGFFFLKQMISVAAFAKFQFYKKSNETIHEAENTLRDQSVWFSFIVDCFLVCPHLDVTSSLESLK